MSNTAFSPPLRSAPDTSLRSRQLDREEERLVHYYRSLSDQDREAIRCLLYAFKTTSGLDTRPVRK
ncbi:hypothetical protein [Pseudomonas sp. MYb193]|uniref:hypothetical protein n=1 Tax=Pseudomonas sp. MYb193 TaxID=1827300 RepID=UPI001319E8D5|nr:hypothetical protein [Pseudomonas sp. MYb193]